MIHKLQSTTFNKTVIDLGKRNFVAGQVYIAPSQMKKLNDIALCDLDSIKLLKYYMMKSIRRNGNIIRIIVHEYSIVVKYSIPKVLALY